MSSITISELNVAGLNLFIDGESYLDEVNDGELDSVSGGLSIVAFSIASSIECAAFAGGLVAGAGAAIGAVNILVRN
jgi:hypothetical protein